MTQTPDPKKSDLPKTSAPSQRALNGAGITHLEDLTAHSEAEILELHGMGPKAMGILRAALSEKGLSFAQDKTSRS
jgi:hypothetical protein